MLAGLSFAVFFGTIWYSVFPGYSVSSESILDNLSYGLPWIVGSVIFMAIGSYMIIVDRKTKSR